MKIIFTTLIILLHAFFANSQVYKFYPPKNDIKDNSLTAFIDSLKSIIDLKEGKSLIKLIDENIQIAFDGNNGKKSFVKEYKPEDPNSDLWKVLDKIVSMGGSYSKNYQTKRPELTSYIFPYANTLELEACDGCYVCMSVIVPDANVRVSPDRLSQSVGKLSYDVVQIIEEPVSKIPGGDSDNWIYIQTFDKKLKGWIRRDLVWDICDYRMFIEKINNQWKITTFIAGD